jgi:cytochrome c peroxidase
MLMACASVALATGAPALEPMPEAAAVENPALVELGRTLFFDRRLSGDGTMSCATCHDPSMAYADGLDISMSYPTTSNWRNSPTLLNVGLAPVLFHDGRAASLEEQALFPMRSAFEMNQDLDYLEQELASVPGYVRAFEAALGPGPITRGRIARALAAFERTLISRGSRLDRHLRGEADALGAEARAGLALFTGKAGCIRCHHGAALSDYAFHRTGVPEHPGMATDPRMGATVRYVGRLAGYPDYAAITEDPGRYLVTARAEDWKAFRTPALRDLAETGPYMHNGVFSSLAEVVEFYNAGGGPGADELIIKPLGLSATERAALVKFLNEALGGTYPVATPPEIP